jgi:hypothetical protein
MGSFGGGGRTTVDDFWLDDGGDDTGPPLTDGVIRDAERVLGVRLPAVYLRLLRVRNGGYLRRDCLPTANPTSWAEDHLRIESVWGVGFDRGIDGPRRHERSERGRVIPGVVVFADTPTGGHDFLQLDYRSCGPAREPSVAHFETEGGVSNPTPVAPSFAAFAAALVDSSRYSDEEAEP